MMISKDTDKLKNVEFIKNFNKITVVGACKEENVRRENLYTFKASKENIQRIKDNIDKKIKKLYEGSNEANTL